jgi:hypothetical protein
LREPTHGCAVQEATVSYKEDILRALLSARKRRWEAGRAVTEARIQVNVASSAAVFGLVVAWSQPVSLAWRFIPRICMLLILPTCSLHVLNLLHSPYCTRCSGCRGTHHAPTPPAQYGGSRGTIVARLTSAATPPHHHAMTTSPVLCHTASRLVPPHATAPPC